MNDSNTGPAADQPAACWSINLDRFSQYRRSFTSLAGDSLCGQCYKEMVSGHKAPSDADLVARISECCAHQPDFISARQPVMESIFRIMLANGNQPLPLEQLGQQLAERRGGSNRISEVALARLLQADRYYGLGQRPC
jgi:hypothetical protein